jgi:hypothetical protein
MFLGLRAIILPEHSFSCLFVWWRHHLQRYVIGAFRVSNESLKVRWSSQAAISMPCCVLLDLMRCTWFGRPKHSANNGFLDFFYCTCMNVSFHFIWVQNAHLAAAPNLLPTHHWQLGPVINKYSTLKKNLQAIMFVRSNMQESLLQPAFLGAAYKHL